MTAIKQEDFIQSIADGFQFISIYHPVDFIKAMGEAYEREQSPAAKNAIAQILMNSRMAAEGHAPYARTPVSRSSSSRSAWTCAGKRR
jgi:fumarate hydratase, class I